jgi:hypothetical protein
MMGNNSFPYQYIKCALYNSLKLICFREFFIKKWRTVLSSFEVNRTRREETNE